MRRFARRRVDRFAALVLAGVLAGCAPSAASPSLSPAASAPVGQGSTEAANVLTYKATMERTGVMPGPGPEGAPTLLWKVDVPGGAAGSPLVVDGQIIILSQDGLVHAFDLADGREAWTVEVGSGAVSTPTIWGGVLYVVTDDGILRTVALDERRPGWTASGFLQDTIVSLGDGIVLAGAPGEIVALDSGDGRERWRSPTGGSDRLALAGGIAYAGGDGSGRLTALDVRDGRGTWRLETGAARVLTPAIAGGGPVVAVRDIAGGRNAIMAISTDGTETWRWEPADRDRIGGHAVTSDRVYVSVDNPQGAVYALDRSSGHELWQQPLAGELVTIPVLANGLILVAGGREGLVAVDAETGAGRWTWDLGPITGGGIVVTGGLAVVATRDSGGDGRVIALAGADDPRVAGHASAPPASPPGPSTQGPLTTLSVDPVEGRTLLLSTAVAPDGTIYVADMANSRILVRLTDGQIESWGTRGSDHGQFDFSEVTQNDASTGVAVSPDGELIAVGDGANHRVQLFNAHRHWLRSIGRLGREDGQFVNPCCVAIGPDNHVWVVDTAQAEVQVFDEAGGHLRTFAMHGAGDGELDRPGWPFVDPRTGEIFVPDFANRRVSVFSDEGLWLRHYDRRLNADLSFGEVNSVSVDSAGRLFVLDGTMRMFVVALDGSLIDVIGPDFPDMGRIEYASFALTPDGRLVLADIGGETKARIIVAQLEAPLWPPPQ